MPHVTKESSVHKYQDITTIFRTQCQRCLLVHCIQTWTSNCNHRINQVARNLWKSSDPTLTLPKTTSELVLNQIMLKMATENEKITLQMKKFVQKLCSEPHLKTSDESPLYVSEVITCTSFLVLFLQSMLKKKLWTEGIIFQGFTKLQ